VPAVPQTQTPKMKDDPERPPILRVVESGRALWNVVTGIEEKTARLLVGQKEHDDRFDAVDESLRKVQATLKDHGKRFDAVDKRFDSIDTQLKAHDKRFDEHDKRFDAIDGRLDEIIELVKGGR
jgi:chromosome segregation ATPase